ncbi:MAG: hypothetical protein ACJ749_17515 [Flavisolibacter sp.]
MKEANGTEHKLIILRPSMEVTKRHPDIGRFFSSMPPGLLFVLMVMSYAIIVSLGIYIGYRRFRNGVVEPGSPLETEVAAVLGLLAFMLGFSFSATWTRYVKRNSYVVEHARMISTCYMRTSLIPEKQKFELRRLLHEYISLMLTFQTSTAKSAAKMDTLHLSMWQQTASLAREDMDGELRSIFTGSVNDLINLSMDRKALALSFHIPNAIWGALLFLGTIGMLAFGYLSGINGMGNVFQLFILPIAFALVVVLISSLNSSNPDNHFKISQRPLRDVLSMMDNFDSLVTV